MTVSTQIPTQTDTAVARLDAWFDTMRGPDGYGGPVVHWWQQSLVYTGAGRDWRYEGIIAGYLHLWERTSDPHWLGKACRAGDDLVSGQLTSGTYAASAFEMNPATAGTPHEAACDVGLLLLALALRKAHLPDWEVYAECADRNLRSFLIGQLWDDTSRSFRDHPTIPSFVPNKAATICDALFLAAELTGDSFWVEQYALPTLDRIVDHQVAPGGPLAGAIAQNSFGARRVDKHFPIYIARCVPALIQGYRWTGSDRYAESALRTVRWLSTKVNCEGTFPTVVYADGTENRYPSWIAPLGDILRAADDAAALGYHAELGAVRSRLLAGQDATGGIRTADGFAEQIGGRPGALPDVRDLIHVVGWCDKAFRYLARHVGIIDKAAESGTMEANCVFRDRTLSLVETPTILVAGDQRHIHYRWHKGDPWAVVAAPDFWLR